MVGRKLAGDGQFVANNVDSKETHPDSWLLKYLFVGVLASALDLTV